MEDSSSLPPDKNEFKTALVSHFHRKQTLIEITELNFQHEFLSPVRDQNELNLGTLVAPIACIEMLHKKFRIYVEGNLNYYFDIDDVHNNVYKKYPELMESRDGKNSNVEELDILKYAKECGLLLSGQPMNPRIKNRYGSFCNERERFKIRSYKKWDRDEENAIFSLSKDRPIVAETAKSYMKTCHEIVYKFGNDGNKECGRQFVLIVGNATLKIDNKVHKFFLVQGSRGMTFGYKGFTLMQTRKFGFINFWTIELREEGRALLLSAEEMKQEIANFDSNALIDEGSEGSHARVSFAKLNNGKKVAVKKLELNPNSNAEFFIQVSNLSRLKDKNLVKLIGYCVDGNLHIFAYELATLGSLYDILYGREGEQGAHQDPVLDWMQRVRIAVDAARGLKYLHEQTRPSIIHGNVKSKNVLVFEDYKAKIDFDLSKQAPGTSYYHAPECAMLGQFTQESDVYSFGVLLLELLIGREHVLSNMLHGQECPPTWLSTVIQSFEKLHWEQIVDPKLEGTYPTKDVAKFADVAAACIHLEPELRPSMKTVVKVIESLLID